MTPRLVVTWTRTPVAKDVPAFRAFVERVPPARRDRLVLRWDEAGPRVLCGMARAARDAGFKRIRVERLNAGTLPDRELAVLVRSGVNEVAFDGGSAPGADVAAALRARLHLAHVVLIVPVPGPAGDCLNPWGADELEVRVDADRLVSDQKGVVGRVDALVAGSAPRFRRVSVRGLALCRIPSLDPGRVVSNALDVRAPEDVLELKFEDPERVFFEPCRTCWLSLACDGFDAIEFRKRKGPRTRVRPFGGGRARVVTLDARGLLHRDHPPTFLSGRVHLMAVAEGIRPAGRVAVDREHLSAQVALIRDAGLASEVVEAPPRDTDRAVAGEVHVFFARDSATARRVADIERSFVRAEQGANPMGPAAFAQEMGRALGYPECCVEAFVKAGPSATTHHLLRRAHARSEAFSWLLNCLDLRSPFQLVPHIPCRFDCGPSLEMARAVADRLDHLFPGLSGTAEALLKRPVLVFGPARAVAFAGAVVAHDAMLDYEAVDLLGSAARSRMRLAVFDSLAMGHRIRLLAGGIEVTGRDGRVQTFRHPARLYPFA